MRFKRATVVESGAVVFEFLCAPCDGHAPTRMSNRRKGLLAVLVALAVPLVSHNAAADSLFFDFEDGLGGWTIFGTVRREETSVLGGNYALFGADLNQAVQILLDIDLTHISHLTLDQLWKSPLRTTENLVTVLVYWTDSDGTVRFGRDRDGTSLIATPSDPFPNPDLRSFDLSGFIGESTVIIQWNELVCPTGALADPCFGTQFAGWIDNVRFYPVPEPSRATLQGTALVVLSLHRLRRNSAKQ